MHTFVCVQWALLRSWGDRKSELWDVLSFVVREVHITDSKLRYDYLQFSKDLGKRVRELRKERGILLRSFVEDHGFHLNQLQRVEAGEGVSLQTVLRLAEVFQIPFEKLVAGLGAVPNEPHPKPSKEQS